MTRLAVREQYLLTVPVEDIWRVVDDTARYAEWVDGVLEVTRHHGRASVGSVYTERNRTLGPLTTNSEWTVQEIEKHRLRVDAGTGFDPLHELVNTFRFESVSPGSTLMTYQVDCRVGLGPIGRVVARALPSSLAAEFGRSMRNLEALVLAERAIERLSSAHD